MIDSLTGLITLAMDIAPHFIPYRLAMESSGQTCQMKKSLSMSNLSEYDLSDLDENQTTEWIDYLKVSLDPMDCMASWKYLKSLRNITCKERLENITWRKYSEGINSKYSITLLDQNSKRFSPSTIHLHFSRGFLNGPVLLHNKQIVEAQYKNRLTNSTFLKTAIGKKQADHPKSIRFKETVDYRAYSNSQETLSEDYKEYSGSESDSLPETTRFGFIEGKEFIKKCQSESSAAQKIFWNLNFKIKGVLFGNSKRRKRMIELVYEYFIGKAKLNVPFKNLAWEPTLIINEEELQKNDNLHDSSFLARIEKSFGIPDFFSYFKKISSFAIGGLNRLKRCLGRLKLWAFNALYSRINKLYETALNAWSGFRTKTIDLTSQLGSISLAVFGTFREIYESLSYIFTIISPYLFRFTLRLKSRVYCNFLLGLYTIRRIFSWKKPVTITDLPTEIKWEILKHLDFESGLKFSRILKIGEFDCIQYHKFFIQFPIKEESGIISFTFRIIGWIFNHSIHIPPVDIDIWTVSYAVEKIIGNSEKKFAILVRNQEFRNYVHDEIVLALACKYGEYSVVRQLIADNDPSYGMNFGIRWAAIKGWEDIVRLLLNDERVDPAVDNNKPLISACENGHVGSVDALLRHSNVDPTLQSNYAIERACYNGHKEVVQRLLKDSRVDPTASRNYCLKVACKRNHLEVVRVLLCDSRIRPGDDDYKLIQRLVQRQSKRIVIR